MKYFYHFLLTTPVFFAIDLLWLGFIGKGFYKKYIGHLMAENVNWAAAFTFYFLFILGILIFAVYPALKLDKWSHALLYGALFGFFTYMTYELTNLAVIKDWSWQIVPIDIIWGTILCASVSTASFFIAKWLF
ncbi:MAG: DUF2177 family protein [Chitinophagales bacterium]|nr:DUF2177 family protein [Chitinophagales bacterium]